MQELVKVTLHNEMDLILAHKRSMKLAELAGLSLSAQTTFATAVSEVSRNVIDNGKNGYLVLSMSTEKRRNTSLPVSQMTRWICQRPTRDWNMLSGW